MCDQRHCGNLHFRSGSTALRNHAIGLVIIAFVILSNRCAVAAAKQTTTGDSFPELSEVFQGRTFTNKSDRDIFFLQAIHDRYHSHWPDLLEANITEQDYFQAPAKMLQFIDELGLAMRDRDDPDAVKNLASVTSDRKFFTNINAYHPEVLRAAAQALINLGPNGRKALADSFSQIHYRDDPESLEELARTIGDARPADSALIVALAATAFDFSTTNGGTYLRCTTEAVKQLLNLPAGTIAVATHLNTNEIFADPVRFQAVLDGIAAARPVELKPTLVAIEPDIHAKLITLKAYPGEYRDALEDLDDRIKKTIDIFSPPKPIRH
jgi:hypothetical protein